MPQLLALGVRNSARSGRPDAYPDPYAKLSVVKTKADLPQRACGGSSAFVIDELKLFRVSRRSIPSCPKWVEHRHMTRDGIMRTDGVYRGGSFLGTKESRA